MMDKKALKEMTIGFYTRLFTSETCSDDGDFLKNMFPALTRELKGELKREYSMEETLEVLKSMGPFKTPGHDRFQTTFFFKGQGVLLSR